MQERSRKTGAEASERETLGKALSNLSGSCTPRDLGVNLGFRSSLLFQELPIIMEKLTSFPKRWNPRDTRPLLPQPWLPVTWPRGACPSPALCEPQPALPAPMPVTLLSSVAFVLPNKQLVQGGGRGGGIRAGFLGWPLLLSPFASSIRINAHT